MYWATSLVVLVCLIVTQARCHNGQYGFVIWKIVNPCVSNPINDICPLDHKVPETSFTNYQEISEDISSIISASFRSAAGGNESCTKAATMFECSRRIKTCKNNLNYYYFDSSRAYRLCMTARQACAGVDKKLRDGLLNCDEVKTRDEEREIRRFATCKEYPRWENDTCPTWNYKVVVDRPREKGTHVLSPSFVQAQQTLQKLLRNNNVQENCSNAVFGAFCEASAPACTRDEQYEVSFLGRYKCYEILRCLNTATNNTNVFDTISNDMIPCDYLPGEDTAKKISIDNIYNMKTPSNPTINTTPTSINTTEEITTTCCKASTLSAMGHILVFFTVWLFLGNFTK